MLDHWCGGEEMMLTAPPPSSLKVLGRRRQRGSAQAEQYGGTLGSCENGEARMAGGAEGREPERVERPRVGLRATLVTA